MEIPYFHSIDKHYCSSDVVIILPEDALRRWRSASTHVRRTSFLRPCTTPAAHHAQDTTVARRRASRRWPRPVHSQPRHRTPAPLGEAPCPVKGAVAGHCGGEVCLRLGPDNMLKTGNLGSRKWFLRVRDWPSQNGVFGFG